MSKEIKYPLSILEEELKNKVAVDFFDDYDHTVILGKVDFAISKPEIGNGLFDEDKHYFYWAECKRGNDKDILHSITQLILTIGKARTFDRETPPKYIGAFDAEKIAFVPYNLFLDVLYKNDFNWNVTPSNHSTPQFQEVLEQIKGFVDSELMIYNYLTDGEELRHFISKSFVYGNEMLGRRMIDRNNFIFVYRKWCEEVMPHIAIDWATAKNNDILAADFFLADLLSEGDVTLRQGLYVLLNKRSYELNRSVNTFGLFTSSRVDLTREGVKAHTRFWNRYHRPPRREYWGYMVSRRDLLVPQDVRERKGAFFTPKIWVELSQQYLADVLGEDWQDEYVVWDCAAGTGNLLVGLTDKYSIFASTLDKQDVDVMHDRIDNGANLMKEHVFRFDFLNDPFTEETLPKALWDIVRDPEKRKKLVIYINPPYVEAGNAKQRSGTGNNRTGVSNSSKVWERYREQMGLGIRELYVQFLLRIYSDLNGCVLGEFSTLKTLQAIAFENFRDFFRAKLEKGFIVPANTFDNVTGSFPIGFKVWNTGKHEKFEEKALDVYDADGVFLGKKVFSAHRDIHRITSWIAPLVKSSKDGTIIGYTGNNGPDYQNNGYLHISARQKKNSNGSISNLTKYEINSHTLLPIAVYFAVRFFDEDTWINDRDQFLYPVQGWEEDEEFQSDCLAFTLFHGQNRISCTEGVNHWIPFREEEVGSKSRFSSRFMRRFIEGKIDRHPASLGGFDFGKGESKEEIPSPIHFSSEAARVMDAGRELWKYYHSMPDANPDAALYDIKAYFQGFSKSGRMNPYNTDSVYNHLLKELKKALRNLAKTKIAPKAYQYRFLMK